MKKSTAYFTASYLLMSAGILMTVFMVRHPILISLFFLLLVSGRQLSLKGKAIYLLEQGINEEEYEKRFHKQKRVTGIIQLIIIITALIVVILLFYRK